MTTKFQAGIGPSMTLCHIYEIPPPDVRAKPSLCKSTNVVRNYKGPISAANSKICKRCFAALQSKLPEGAAITAEIIGVSSIEE